MINKCISNLFLYAFFYIASNAKLAAIALFFGVYFCGAAYGIQNVNLDAPLNGYAPCNWREELRKSSPFLLISEGTDCHLSDLEESIYINKSSGIYESAATIFVERGARLTIGGDAIFALRLHSSLDGHANLIAEGSTLILDRVQVISHNTATGGPDLYLQDGRSFIKVVAFVDKDGEPRNAHIEITDSTIAHLGYETRGTLESAGYGLSLKVRKETELSMVAVTGSIRDSVLKGNYRGYYSYGARDVLFENNLVFHNMDYGVDPHDSSTGFIARNNLITLNGGTGLALSRRCSDSIIEDNRVIRNGKNGILIHDLSNGVIVSDNFVAGNGGDGIVVHDSADARVLGNIIERNRNGLRVFAGSTLVDVIGNTFEENRGGAILLMHGWLDQYKDLSDRSDPSYWNGINISRHNDGRTRNVYVTENFFYGNTRVVSREARNIVFERNNYFDYATFDFKDTHNVALDGRGSPAHISYVFRRSDEKSLSYSIDPPLKANVSMHAFDKVTLISGDTAYISGSSEFTLNLSANSNPVIAAFSARGQMDIRSGELYSVPMTVSAGSVTVESITGKIDGSDPVRLDLSSEDWSEVVLSLSSKRCAVFVWSISHQFKTEAKIIEFYSLPNQEISTRDINLANGARIIANISCISN